MKRQETKNRWKKEQEIYVITEGTYSEYGIKTIFSDLDIAQKAIKKFGGEIEIWKIDDCKDFLDSGNFYLIEMNRKGNIQSIEKWNRWYSIENGDSRPFLNKGKEKITLCVFANDESHAIRIANKKRIRFIAEGKWN